MTFVDPTLPHPDPDELAPPVAAGLVALAVRCPVGDDMVVMCPCDMPPPNDLRPGDIVVNGGQRGVVVIDYSEQTAERRTAALFMAPSQGVAIAPLPYVGNSHTVTDNHHRDWVIVPVEEQSVVERVWSTHFGWKPLSNQPSHEPGGEPNDPADDDSEAWHLLYALLDEAELDEVTDGDWPGCLELALAVAAAADRVATASRPATRSQPPRLRRRTGTHRRG